jgi:hypothetical protein
MYRSPNSAPETMEKLTEYVRKVEEDSIVMGDFNLPGINWKESGNQ